MKEQTKLMLSGGVMLILGFLIGRMANAVQQSYAKISLLFTISAWILLIVGFGFGVIAAIKNFTDDS